MIKELQESEQKFFDQGGGPNCPCGGTQFVLDGGGTGSDGGDSPFIGIGSGEDKARIR